MKNCNKCLLPKDESEFAFKNKANNLLQAMCKECHKTYSKLHYSSNKESYISKAKRNKTVYSARNQQYIDEYKRNKGCYFCQESEPACLDFHHLRDKIADVAYLLHQAATIERIQTEIDKCEVLCANCHRKLHANLISFK